jgi:hypothetical protein
MFSTAGMKYGTAGEPAPRVMDRGIGLSICVAWTSLLIAQSRITAQPETRRTVTFNPCLA